MRKYTELIIFSRRNSDFRLATEELQLMSHLEALLRYLATQLLLLKINRILFNFSAGLQKL